MALVTVNLSDPVSSLVTKTNLLSKNTGDLDSLDAGITSKASLAKAVNFVFQNATDSAQILALINDNATDSAAIVSLVDSDYVKIRSTQKLTISNAAGSLGTLAFEPDTGVITNTGTTQTQIRAQFQKDSAQGIAFDSARGSFSVALGSVQSDRFKSPVALLIKDSGGSVLKTLFSRGA